MTDHDRGAYTPQPDAPLQFDARGPRGRKPMPMTLIGSGAVLLVVLGALALHYRHDSKVGAEGPRPVGEPIAQVKGAAPSTAQPKDAGGAIDVFGGKATDEAKTTTLAPPPEAPKPRLQIQAMDPLAGKPAPVTTTAAVIPPVPAPAATPKPATIAAAKVPPPTATIAKAPTTAPAAATVAKAPIYNAPVAPPKTDATSVINKLAAAPVAKPTPAKPVPTVAAAAPATKAAIPTTAAKPTQVAAAKVPTAKAATPAASGGSVVQIGAFSSAALSDKGFADVSAAMAGQMGGKIKRVEELEKDGKTLYRTSVVGFPSRDAANAFCKALAAKGHTCFAKG